MLLIFPQHMAERIRFVLLCHRQQRLQLHYVIPYLDCILSSRCVVDNRYEWECSVFQSCRSPLSSPGCSIATWRTISALVCMEYRIILQAECAAFTMQNNRGLESLARSSKGFSDGSWGYSGTHSRSSSSWPPKKGASKCTCGALASREDHGGDVDDCYVATTRASDIRNSVAFVIFISSKSGDDWKQASPLTLRSCHDGNESRFGRVGRSFQFNAIRNTNIAHDLSPRSSNS